MLEHFDNDLALRFLRECYRILKVGGVVRIVVPDLDRIVHEYVQNKNADSFMSSLNVTKKNDKNVISALYGCIFGDFVRHKWMYDASSLSRLFRRANFTVISEFIPGESMIKFHAPLNLCERKDESIFIEAMKTDKNHVC